MAREINSPLLREGRFKIHNIIIIIIIMDHNNPLVVAVHHFYISVWIRLGGVVVNQCCQTHTHTAIDKWNVSL